MKYLLFGASIAWGVGDYKWGGWAGHLAKYINIREKNNSFINLAISGDNSRGLLNRFEREAKLRIRNNPKEETTIIITIGTNDSQIDKLNPEKSIPEEEFGKNIIEILKISKRLSGNVSVIGLFPVYEEKTTSYKEQKYYYQKNNVVAGTCF